MVEKLEDLAPSDMAPDDLCGCIEEALAVLRGDGEAKHLGKWRARPDSDDLDAIGRHAARGAGGIDADSGETHAAHILARALCIAMRERAGRFVASSGEGLAVSSVDSSGVAK